MKMRGCEKEEEEEEGRGARDSHKLGKRLGAEGRGNKDKLTGCLRGRDGDGRRGGGRREKVKREREANKITKRDGCRN